MENLFTFWEGPIPAYIKMCIETWRGPYKQTFLNYQNLKHYTDIDLVKLTDPTRKLSLPQIADYIRVHVLRDNGGYWLDTDTIMITDKLPTANIAGNPHTRTNTIGFLHTEADSDMFTQWAAFQDKMLTETGLTNWDIMGNAFTDRYIREHEEISIVPVSMFWPEIYKVQGTMPRRDKYRTLYFGLDCKLADLLPTDMLMLHNSWTPDWYKKLNEHEVRKQSTTLSNILGELV